MKTTFFSRLGYKLMTLIIAFLYSINGYVAPATDDPIQTSAQTGANLTVVAWADSQVSNYMFKRFPFFDAACEDISNIDDTVDALMIAGDVAENGLRCEYQYVSEKLANAKTDNYLMLVGNHDVRLKVYKNTVKKFTEFANNLNGNVQSELKMTKLNYRYDIKGYTFLVMGTDRTEFEESYFNEAQLNWLDENLADATASGKPVFVLCHQPLKLTHGLPLTWGSPIDAAGSVGAQSDAIKNILNKYEKIFFITGHLHTGIGQYTYEKIDNFYGINLPSLTIDNKDGECNDNGIGFMMEVFDNHVLFRARNFAQGKYLPDYDIDVDF